MSKLRVSSFDEKGITKYSLIDDLSKEVYQEDFKPVVFDTEEAAEKRLGEYESERSREENAKPFSLEEARQYAESHYWKFASTYAKTAPHEYCIKRWLVKEDQLLYERFVATMRTQSVVGYFYGHKNMYLILGDHYYWYMPGPENVAIDLINRTTTDYLVFKDGAYYYKEKSSDDNA